MTLLDKHSCKVGTNITVLLRIMQTVIQTDWMQLPNMTWVTTSNGIQTDCYKKYKQNSG